VPHFSSNIAAAPSQYQPAAYSTAGRKRHRGVQQGAALAQIPDFKATPGFKRACQGTNNLKTCVAPPVSDVFAHQWPLRLSARGHRLPQPKCKEVAIEGEDFLHRATPQFARLFNKKGVWVNLGSVGRSGLTDWSALLG
jgi:hypothetical protein